KCSMSWEKRDGKFDVHIGSIQQPGEALLGGFGFFKDGEDEGFEGLWGQACQAHEHIKQGAGFGKKCEQAPPQFAAGGEHPGFVVDLVGLLHDVLVGFVIESIEAMKTDELCGRLDEFVAEYPEHGATCHHFERILAMDHAAIADGGEAHETAT